MKTTGDSRMECEIEDPATGHRAGALGLKV